MDANMHMTEPLTAGKGAGHKDNGSEVYAQIYDECVYLGGIPLPSMPTQRSTSAVFASPTIVVLQQMQQRDCSTTITE